MKPVNVTKTYMFKIVVEGTPETKLPEPWGLREGIVDGLPEAWFTLDEGDEFMITHISPIEETGETENA